MQFPLSAGVGCQDLLCPHKGCDTGPSTDAMQLFLQFLTSALAFPDLVQVSLKCPLCSEKEKEPS